MGERREREARKGFVEAALPAGGTLGPEPDAADLALINQRYALAPLAAADLYVRRMVLAHDAVDRTYEQFPPAVLERFAQTLPGKPVLVAHDKSELPIGMIYRAQVRPARAGEVGQVTLEAALYMLRTAANAEVRGQIDAGVIRSVSIGFRYDTRLCSVCGEDYFDCPHVPGEVIAPGAGSRSSEGALVTYTYAGDMTRYEACECSLVYLGCQQEAAIIKGRALGVEGWGLGPTKTAVADPNPQRPTPNAPLGGTTMDNEKAQRRIRELEAEVARLTGELEAVKEADGATGGRGDGATEPEPDDGRPVPPSPCPPVPSETAALVAEGKAYRQHLRAEVLRLAGILKSETEAGLLLKALPHAPVEALQELLESYQARVEEKFPPRGLGEMGAPSAVIRHSSEAAGPARPFRFS